MTGKELIRLIRQIGEERDIMIAVLKGNNAIVYSDEDISNVCKNGDAVQITIEEGGGDEQ